MEHYQQIDLLPDPEFPQPLLMNALFSKLHRALAGLGSRGIGVCFPGWDRAKPTLGPSLRLHGSRQNLALLAATGWLNGMAGHCRVGEAGPAPQSGRHLAVRRVQAKSSPKRLARRLAKRKGISLEEAAGLIPGKPQYLALPYVSLRSLSTGQAFRLFIRQSDPLDQAESGEFNNYGLSATATVPWF